MKKLSMLSERDFRRHQLIYVSQSAWQDIIEARDDLKEPLIADWVVCGRPLIMRRPCTQEKAGVPLGLPLPPSMGKRRIAISVDENHILATRPPPFLTEVWQDVPDHWKESLAFLRDNAVREDWEVRVFGSLAWQWLTGLPYLSGTSDLDLILSCRSTTDLALQSEVLTKLEAMAPMRIDAEFVLSDGSAVNWRELHNGQTELLVKDMVAARLVSRLHFLQVLAS